MNTACRPFLMLLAAAHLLAGLGCTMPLPRTQVVVMGTLHDRHRTSSSYGIEQVQQLVRRINPDYILCEIPPDRLDAAVDQYRSTGEITEPRVRLFPEYVDAIIPLRDDMHFELIPCSAWTADMDEVRRQKLTAYRTSRAEDFQCMQQAMQEANARIAEQGLNEDPHGVHSTEYDRLMSEGMQPYNDLFNEDLGPGGWDNINRAHYALMTAALDRHRGEGRRFLITFGAAHKYWFLQQLRGRDDITVLDITRFLDDAPGEQAPGDD